MTRNEIREKENLPAVPGGDELATQPAAGDGSPSPPAAAPDQARTAQPQTVVQPVVVMPEREERLITKAMEAQRDAFLYAVHGLTGELRDSVVVPAPEVVVNVAVPEQKPPVVNIPAPVLPAPVVNVNVPQQPAPNVVVNVPPEPPRQIVLRRDASGRLKSATIEEA